MEDLIFKISIGGGLAIIGVLLMIGELLMPGFVLLPIGLSFLFTAAVSLLLKNWAGLLVVLALTEIGCFLIFKKLRRFHGKTNVYTNAEGMVGQECLVVEPVGAQAGGYVKLYGDLWPARSVTGATFGKGDRVVIAKIEGNKVIVEPISGLEE